MARSRRVAVTLLVACCAALGACTTAGSSTAAHGDATASFVYAGSLVGLVQSVLTPQFERATGDSLTGKGDGSLVLTKEIADGELSPGGFLSVGRSPIEALWPKRSRFVVQLATDPLVVAYNAKSRYAPTLDRISAGRLPLADLFRLFERPGFRLGRTDPSEDPQGQFFMMMVELASRRLGLPGDTAARILGTSRSQPAGRPSQIFSETALEPQLVAGNLDAASAYLSEAIQYHLHYIALPPALDFAVPSRLHLYKTVGLRLAGGARVRGRLITLDATLVLPPEGTQRPEAQQRADVAFLTWLLSRGARSDLRHSGYELGRPVLSLAPKAAARSAVPAPLLAALHRLGAEVVSG